MVVVAIPDEVLDPFRYLGLGTAAREDADLMTTLERVANHVRSDEAGAPQYQKALGLRCAGRPGVGPCIGGAGNGSTEREASADGSYRLEEVPTGWGHDFAS